MITADIPDQGTIDTTLPATSDPLYQVAALSLFYRQMFAELKSNGFQFARPEVTDFSAFKSGLETYLSDAYDRETEIIQTGVATTVANLPDVLSIGAAFASGGASAAGACILNILLGKLLGGDSGAHGDYENAQASPDMSEVVSQLEAVTTAIHTVMNEYTINIHADKEDVTFSGGRKF